ncbi:hypothetical protein DZ860_04730 [Vibrio sinensis]|uniref:DNA polymerase III subunit beta n=1 Tax=Vibrio sinensis TaxID=2302434 RepID=A0A3A6QP12_9VIBR|nr:hypothetical protein [Vibrio sinensis]RJX74435.1 hypothetical protein DZ860_04730 [Vibrio sinensis]
MKSRVMMALGVVLLAGCSSHSSTQQWAQDNQIVISGQTIELKSNLWLNKMPTIGEVQDQTLHGALYLESQQTLPAELGVNAIMIKQGDETWLIDGEQLDLRTHDENQWEVAFVWQLAVDPEQPVDIAISVDHGDKQEWLVEKEVLIDTVY